MDQIVGPAQQPEVVRVVQLQHVGQRRGRLYMAALHQEALGAVVRHVAPDAQRAQRVPGLASRGAAGGHLAGFGAAVDLDQPAPAHLLGLLRQLRRQRRRGRQQQLHLRQRHARPQQRLQVEGRGHQGTRRRHLGQRGGDVGREKGPAGVEAGTAQQGQQHRRFQAIAVLRRHRGQHGEALQRGPFAQRCQALGLGGDVEDQRAPAFAVGLGRAGAAAGEQAHRLQRGRDQRHLGGRSAVRGDIDKHALQAADVQRRVVQQCIRPLARPRAGAVQRTQGVGQRIGRHQTGLAAQQGSGQPQRKPVAVLAQVDGLALGRQRKRELGCFTQELRSADRHAPAPGQRCGQVALGQQGQGGGRHGRVDVPVARQACSTRARLTRSNSGWRW